MDACLLFFACCFVGVALASTGGQFVGPNVAVVPNTGSLMDKIITGYTGNQNLPNDGSGLGYGTWAESSGKPGTNSYPFIDPHMYADANLYPVPEQWPQTLGNGKQAVLYSGVDPAVTDIHFNLMRTYGVHGATIERFLFSTEGNERALAFRNRVLANAAQAAVKYGRLFYVFYDLSGAESQEATWNALLVKDFNLYVKRYTTNPNWAKHQGKPVMLMWPGPHRINQTNLATAINYFKDQGYAVVLGVAQNFRADYQDYWNTYALADIIFVWCNGVSYNDDMDGVLKTAMGDAQWCQQRNKDYQFNVCVGPPVSRAANGTVFSPEPTHATQNLKLWTHYTILSRLRQTYPTGVSCGGFLAMFDDYPEIVPLILTAPDNEHLPGGKPTWWSGTAIPPALGYDYSLRLNEISVEMLNKNVTFPVAIPIPFTTTTPSSTLNRTIPAGNTVLSKTSTSMVANIFVPTTSYIGCYADNAARDLWRASSVNGSTKLCAAFCEPYYVPYFGLQDGDQCYCGYSYGSVGPSNACTTPCSQDPSEKCGGRMANSVYRVQLEIEKVELAYKGCFSDRPQRDLPIQAGDAGSIQECASNCHAYTYFALQAGGQCFCGNSYGKYGTSTGCTQTCHSDPTQTCGGGYANSVWTFIQ